MTEVSWNLVDALGKFVIISSVSVIIRCISKAY